MAAALIQQVAAISFSLQRILFEIENGAPVLMLSQV